MNATARRAAEQQLMIAYALTGNARATALAQWAENYGWRMLVALSATGVGGVSPPDGRVA